MGTNWQESIYRQREELARMLREPIECCARAVTPFWNDRKQIEEALLKSFSSIPYCSSLYVLDTNGVQICDNVGASGIIKGHFARDRSQRPYMKEAVPSWGFLLSDAYISLYKHRPSLTALQVIRDDEQVQGYLGADFDLHDLPVTAELYREPVNWRQVKGDPAIRTLVFQQTRVESLMDEHHEQAFAILEEMLTRRGVFQMQIHFSSSQATIWTKDDPFRYRILDMDALTDPDICLLYPHQEYPADALIPADNIEPILENLHLLRTADENIYLRLASINLFNGMISLTFSCDGSHYMPYDEFLQKNADFWFGFAA